MAVLIQMLKIITLMQIQMMVVVRFWVVQNHDAFGFNPNANIDDGSCVPYNFGCIDNGTEISGTGEVNDFDNDGLAAFNYNPSGKY